MGVMIEQQQIEGVIEMTSPREMLQTLQAKVREFGYRNSACDWADDENAFAFSFETHGPSTYGSPKLAVSFSINHGKVVVQGDRRSL